MMNFVCAKCGADCREVRELRDENGNVFQASTVCAYCGRSELRLKWDNKSPDEGRR